MTPAKFIARFFAFVVGLGVLSIALNAIVDPYLLFGSPRIDGLNDRKSSAGTHERQMKQYDARRRSARTLVLGSSRTGIGFNSLSESWLPGDRPVYNLSLAGSDPETSIHYLRHFLAGRSSKDMPHTLVIGLDFESFLYPESNPEAWTEFTTGFETTSLLVFPDGRENTDRVLQTVADYARSTLSLDAFLSSLSTIFNSIGDSGANLDDHGWMDETVISDSARANGIAALFSQKNVETIKQYGAEPLALRESTDQSLRDIAAVRELVGISAGINARVILFIQPAHADRWEIMDRLGYWEELERWKRALVDLVDTERNAGVQVELWDFASYESYVQEVPPAQGNHTSELAWFWEPAHYRSTLGDIMISRMRNSESPFEFGERLTARNIDEWLLGIRTDRMRYRHAYPEENERIDELF